MYIYYIVLNIFTRHVSLYYIIFHYIILYFLLWLLIPLCYKYRNIVICCIVSHKRLQVCSKRSANLASAMTAYCTSSTNSLQKAHFSVRPARARKAKCWRRIGSQTVLAPASCREFPSPHTLPSNANMKGGSKSNPVNISKVIVPGQQDEYPSYDHMEL